MRVAISSSAVRLSAVEASRLVLKALCIPKRRMRLILSNVSVFMVLLFIK
jgi:hypothetical protein